MNKSKTIRLANDVIIKIEENTITCIDHNNTIINLTTAQEKLLKKLSDHVNRTVDFQTLYSSYAGEKIYLTDQDIVNSNVTKIMYKIPTVIRTSIKNKRNVGYYLEGRVQNEDTTEFSYLTELTGEYYGFYLDPLGDGTLLNAYLHIKNIGTTSSPQIAAYIISGIRNRQILCSNGLTHLFSSNDSNLKQDFEAFKETLSENDKRCSLGIGTVTLENTLAIIDLKMNHGKWEILLDFENYLKGTRKKKEDKDYYRGGLGLVLASRTIHGTCCLRIGFVRKSFMKNTLCSENKKLLEILKIQDGSRDAEWKPLKLSGFLDKCWYNMIMDE